MRYLWVILIVIGCSPDNHEDRLDFIEASLDTLYERDLDNARYTINCMAKMNQRIDSIHE